MLQRRTSPLKRFMMGAGLIVLAAFYGLMCSILPAQLLFVPLAPILLMGAVCLWLLPDVGDVDTLRMRQLMLTFFALFGLWPNYIALDLPGLPWITPVRIVMGALSLIALVVISSSGDTRARIWDAMNTVPLLRKLFWAFWLCTTISLVFSNQLTFSINKYLNNQIFWTLLFAITCYAATYRGFVGRACQMLVIGVIGACMAGLYEWHIERVYWLDHLPSFLKVDPAFLEQVAKAQNRAGTDIYRVRGTMAVSLYFAEYLAMMFPMVVHFLINARTVMHKLLLGAALFAMMTVMYATNARSAMVGIVLTIGLYPFFLVWRARQRHKASIAATAGVMAYPAMVMVVALLVIFWRRAHVMVLGGGQHQPSSEAREVQWAMGIPKIMRRPLGHGQSTSGDVLGYMNGNGEVTVDSYYLTVLLEHGVFALPVLMLMFGLPLWFGFWNYLKARTPEQDLLAPLAVGMFNFIVIKGVLSSEGDMPLAFAMLGMLIGLIWQIRRAEAGEAPRLISPAVAKANGRNLPVPVGARA